MKARRRPSAALLGLAAILVSSSAAAEAPYWCDSFQKPPPGKPIDGRFMGLPYEIIGHALAEKVCGARHKLMGTAILDAIQKEGCGPTTEIYREVADTISKIESNDLRFMVSEGQTERKLTRSEVRKRAAYQVRQFGGCAKLLKNHDARKP